MLPENDIRPAFSSRLIQLMKEAGYTSKRGVGVRLQDLSEAAGCTQEMARRYLTGLALPDYPKVLKIAKWLKTYPGDLLFGSKDTYALSSETEEQYNEGIIYYILKVAINAAKKTREKELQDLIETTYDVIHDTALIEGDMAAKKKMVDQSFSFFIENQKTERKKVHRA